MLLLCLGRRAHFPRRALTHSAASSLTQGLRTGPDNCQHTFRANPRRFLTNDVVPLRKQLKDEAKARKAAALETQGKTKAKKVDGRLKDWELTVGIEIHAQLNTARKLFSCMSGPLGSYLDSYASLQLHPPPSMRLQTNMLPPSTCPSPAAYPSFRRRLFFRPYVLQLP